MKIEFKDKKLEELYTGATTKAPKGFPPEMVKPFRKKISLLQSAETLKDLEHFPSLDFKAVNYYKQGSYSIRVNDKYRLILEIEEEKNLIICEFIDYHDRI